MHYFRHKISLHLQICTIKMQMTSLEADENLSTRKLTITWNEADQLNNDVLILIKIVMCYLYIVGYVYWKLYITMWPKLIFCAF